MAPRPRRAGRRRPPAPAVRPRGTRWRPVPSSRRGRASGSASAGAGRAPGHGRTDEVAWRRRVALPGGGGAGEDDCAHLCGSWKESGVANSGWRMPTSRQAWLLVGILAVTIFGAVGIMQQGNSAVPTIVSPTASGTPRSNLPTIPITALPAEAMTTLDLIARGGPYPYRQDGTVFSNLERRLPERDRGYYREFTVVTPGESSRG